MPQITCKHRYDFIIISVITPVFTMQDYGSAIEHRCFLTGRHRVIIFKSALRHMFEECLLDYLGNTIVFLLAGPHMEF